MFLIRWLEIFLLILLHVILDELWHHDIDEIVYDLYFSLRPLLNQAS